MVKKMWAIFYKGRINKTVTDNKAEIYTNRKSAKEYGGDEPKPVWVTDRDPFENVREFISRQDKAVIDYDGLETAILVEKLVADLKNFDEGAE